MADMCFSYLFLCLRKEFISSAPAVNNDISRCSSADCQSFNLGEIGYYNIKMKISAFNFSCIKTVLAFFRVFSCYMLSGVCMQSFE